MTDKMKVFIFDEGQQLNVIEKYKGGIPIPSLQKKGAPIPRMQPSKPSTTTATDTTQDQGQGSSSQDGDKKKE
jgi:hypothetical protein